VAGGRRKNPRRHRRGYKPILRKYNFLKGQESAERHDIAR
jgi:hypothetical protein